MNTDWTLEKLKKDLVLIVEKQQEAQQTSFDAFSAQLSAFVKEGQLLPQQQSILQTLIFEEMEQREETIKDAHKKTLDWMFERNEISFMEWLESEEEIYWVKGKVRNPLLTPPL